MNHPIKVERIPSITTASQQALRERFIAEHVDPLELYGLKYNWQYGIWQDGIGHVVLPMTLMSWANISPAVYWQWVYRRLQTVLR